MVCGSVDQSTMMVLQKFTPVALEWPKVLWKQLTVAICLVTKALLGALFMWTLMLIIVIGRFSRLCYQENLAARLVFCTAFENIIIINNLFCLKGVDSALIPTLSFPAFASHEERLVDLTKNNVITRLRGKKGFKRFSRDGFLCRLEDKTRRYYHKAEIKDFEGNECEWPMFYTYLIIDGVFRNQPEQIEEYQLELRKCMYSDLNGGL